MAANCNTIDYSSLTKVTTLNPTDEFLIMVIGGTPKRICLSDLKACFDPTSPAVTLPAYKDHADAIANGITSGQRWKASNPNLMGVPPGTVIELP